MSHGVYVNGKRPQSKKAIKEAIEKNPDSVSFENTSMHGGSDFSGSEAPIDLTFVGPCPYTKRNFYGVVARKKDGTITVK